MALTSTHHFNSEPLSRWEFLWGVELVCGRGRVGGELGELSNEESMKETFFASSSLLRAKIGFKTFCPPVNHQSFTLSYQLPEASDWGGVCFAGGEIWPVWSTESLAASLRVFAGVLGEDAESSSSLSDNCLALRKIKYIISSLSHWQEETESPISLCASLWSNKNPLGENTSFTQKEWNLLAIRNQC